MQFKHTLLATILATGFILPAAAHEITFAVGGLSSTLNSEQKYTDSVSQADIHSAGTHTSLGGEAALGYVWNVNSGFDIGFEMFYDFVNDLQVYASYDALDTVNNVWGGRVMPAFRITNNTKIFIDLGYALIDQTLDISKVNPSGTVPGFSSTSVKSNNKGGFQYGAGVETMIYNTIGIRLAYTVQQTAELKLSSDDGTQSFKTTPTVYDFFFGGTYHFQF